MNENPHFDENSMDVDPSGECVWCIVIFVGKREIVLCCAVVEPFNFILGLKVMNFSLKFDNIDCYIKCVIISFIST